MNFQAYLEDTFRIIKEEPVILILGGLVVQLLTMLTMGILAGPFLGGYFLLIIYYLRENRKPTFNDIFSGLQQFGNLLPYFLVLLLIFLGLMLLVLPGLLFATWWLYVLPLMVDRKMPFLEAMRLSRSTVNEKGFLMHFVFLLLISVIPIMLLNFLSTMVPFLFMLKIFLPPFQVGCLASLYIDQFDEFKEVDDEQKNETSFGSTPVTRPQAEETGDQVEQESEQSEQPVSEKVETSEQAATEPLPEENTLDEKPEETDGRPNQAEETGAKVEEEPKQTEQPVSEEAIIQDQVEIQSEQVEETDPQKPDTE
jgi:hypothetical protein